MMTIKTISKRLIAVGDAVRIAVDAVRADDAADDELGAALDDLAARHKEAKNRSKDADPRVAAELVHMLEAVADEVKQLALDADGIAESTRRAVSDAHDAISALESDVDAPTRRGL
jgi:cysteine sulfinate desulfinase/cysteine desulfurase-like protein